MTLDPTVVIAGIGTVAATVIGAGIRRVWVWGWTYSQMESDRDFWRDTALRAMGQTEKAIRVVEKQAGA